ncbi:hypothetical protein [Moumouvirus maliensis]|nr:hypothetical protein [Moumouvirus maliensis]
MSSTHLALEMTERLFEELVASGFNSVVKPKSNTDNFPVLDLYNLVRVMTANTLSFGLEQIIDLHAFVMRRLAEFNCPCRLNLQMKQYFVEFWKAGRLVYEPYFCYNYRVKDLSQVYPFVIEWILSRDGLSLDFDKESFKKTNAMISRLTHSLIKVGYKNVKFVKFCKNCRDSNRCSCDKSSVQYLDLKKLVFVLTDGGNIGHEDLAKLYTFLYDQIQIIDPRWQVWFSNKSIKIPSTVFTKGKFEKTIINGHAYRLEDLALVSHVVCLFIEKHKPNIWFME